MKNNGLTELEARELAGKLTASLPVRWAKFFYYDVESFYPGTPSAFFSVVLLGKSFSLSHAKHNLFRAYHSVLYREAYEGATGITGNFS